MMKRPSESFGCLGVLMVLGIGCATGDELAGDGRATGGRGNRDGGFSGSDPGAGGGLASGGALGNGGLPGVGAGGATSSGGATGAGGIGGDPCEDSSQKRCAGLCVDPSPALGCSLDSCNACPAVTNGTAICTGTTCDVECDPGFTQVGGGCLDGDAGVGAGGAGAGGAGSGGMSMGGSGPDGGGSPTIVDFGYTPSNFDPTDPQISLDGLSATRLDCGTSTFDSETLTFGNWCGAPTPTPIVTGDGYVVIPLVDLTIASGATLDVTGNRPVIIAVFGNATIDGEIDASASAATPGPGGDVGCGASAGPNGAAASGGGGGGFLTAGGQGGEGDNGTVTAAGVARGAPELIPLIGGCGGGDGSHGAPGGAGGGALQLSAAGSLVVSGAVRANGGTGAEHDSSNQGGGGGGSGGAILLEGQSVATPGSVVANGGDGGEGDSSNGGDGGTQNSAPENGQTDSNDGGGGGGGSAGRIRINSAS